MRKLKLQMQISLDGFVKADYGGTNFNWDNEVRSFSINNLKKVDCILLGGRKYIISKKTDFMELEKHNV